jgi:hypothetical protein
MLGFRPKRLILCGVAALAVTLVAVAGTRHSLGEESATSVAPAAPAQASGTQANKSTDKATNKADTKANAKAGEGGSRAYVWSARRKGSTLMLRGFVPSEEDRRTVLGMVKAHFAELVVEDRLKVMNGGPPHEQWLGAVSFGLKQLARLKQGSARLLNDGLKIEGEARSSEDFAEVQKALAGALPTGLVLLNESIDAPVADPFVFVAALDPNALTLTGSVPSEDTRKLIKDWSRRYFERPSLDDRLQLASGAPKNWTDAVEVSLRALSRLDTGKVSLSGVAITIEGMARDRGTAIAVSYQLRRDLPELFSSSESIRWKEAEVPRTIGELILPRIKEIVHSDGELPTGSIPAGNE